jgi:hypothetical protein
MNKELTAEDIFNNIAQKYKGNSRNTRVSIVENEGSKLKSSYQKIRDKKSRAKTLWILVETNEIRVKVREEIANMFGVREFYDSAKSSIGQIRIKNFKKVDGIEEVRIMFKPFLSFNLRKYKWENQDLINILGKSKLGKPDNPDEAEVLQEINQKIFEMGGSVTIRIKNKTYKNVIGFNAGPSGAKADFVIINSNGDSIGWISYKAGNTSKDFQQYSGITRHAGENIYNHPQVKEFREKLVADEQLQNQIKSDKKAVFIRIKRSGTLKNRAVFGKEFGRRRGIHNVDWFAQGSLSTRTQGQIIYVSFSKKLVENGRINQLNQDYDPIIAARKGEGTRRITADNREPVRGIRGGIFPQGMIESRNAIDMSGF